MRARPAAALSTATALVAAALLLIPATATAQRLPIGRRPGPTRPAPLPNMPPTVAREMAYFRLPYAVESYPMLSYFHATGAPGVTSWAAGGVGTRLDLRVAPIVSATLDLTTSFLGSPSYTHTVELGTRLRPERTGMSTRRWFPYIDVRGGYAASLQQQSGTVIVDPFTGSTPVGPGSRYSTGFGAALGTGIEYAMTRRVSLVSGASVLQSRMQTRSIASENRVRYTMTAYRYVLALRFSPVRAINMPGDR